MARSLGWLVPAVTVGGLVPGAIMAADALSGALGANPIQRATQQTGMLAVILLVLSLACTPARRLAGWTWPPRIRKALGLLAFTYAAGHFGIYLLDHGFNLGEMLSAVAEKPFITVGFAALVLLVPLALTSTPRAVRRLGFARWTRLHQLVYIVAVLVAVHFYWAVKKDHTQPLIWGAVLAALLLARVLWRPSKRGQAGRGKTPHPQPLSPGERGV